MGPRERSWEILLNGAFSVFALHTVLVYNWSFSATPHGRFRAISRGDPAACHDMSHATICHNISWHAARRFIVGNAAACHGIPWNIAACAGFAWDMPWHRHGFPWVPMACPMAHRDMLRHAAACLTTCRRKTQTCLKHGVGRAN